MFTINYQRDLDSDFPDLGSNLIAISQESSTDGLERGIVLFDDGIKMEVIGTGGAVTSDILLTAYHNLGYDQRYGFHPNTYGNIEYSHVKYIAHSHPQANILDENKQGRPSGADVSFGNTADYGVSKDLIGGKPHYVVSPTHVYCMNFSKDDRIITSYRIDIRVPVTPVQMEVSFYGRWNWKKQPNGTVNILYVSDDHYDPEELRPVFGQPNIIIEQTLEPIPDITQDNAKVTIDENGTITIESNENVGER